jgi:uncharacterized protein
MSIATPCTNVCTIDHRTGYCMGCGRTGVEIGGWLAMTRDERSAVMAELPARMAAVNISPPTRCAPRWR